LQYDVKILNFFATAALAEAGKLVQREEHVPEHAST
jgi:hypothetical protein